MGEKGIVCGVVTLMIKMVVKIPQARMYGVFILCQALGYVFYYLVLIATLYSRNYLYPYFYSEETE